MNPIVTRSVDYVTARRMWRGDSVEIVSRASSIWTWTMILDAPHASALAMRLSVSQLRVMDKVKCLASFVPCTIFW